MPNAVKWASPATIEVVGTELDSLGSGSVAAISAEYANAANNHRWASYALSVDFASAPTSGGTVDLYLIPEIDLAAYATVTASTVPQLAYLICQFTVQNVATAEIIGGRSFVDGGLICQIPPLDYKFVVVNNTSQAFPASGSTIDQTTYNEEIQ